MQNQITVSANNNDPKVFDSIIEFMNEAILGKDQPMTPEQDKSIRFICAMSADFVKQLQTANEGYNRYELFALLATILQCLWYHEEASLKLEQQIGKINSNRQLSICVAGFFDALTVTCDSINTTNRSSIMAGLANNDELLNRIKPYVIEAQKEGILPQGEIDIQDFIDKTKRNEVRPGSKEALIFDVIVKAKLKHLLGQ
jgi:hypothetical protein